VTSVSQLYSVFLLWKETNDAWAAKHLPASAGARMEFAHWRPGARLPQLLHFSVSALLGPGCGMFSPSLSGERKAKDTCESLYVMHMGARIAFN
jgi:hypothetical protein